MAATPDLPWYEINKEGNGELDQRDRSASEPTQCPDSAAYRPSHRRLLRPLHDSAVTQASCPPLGAVVVPTSRSFEADLPGVALAAQLAISQASFLLVLCSRAARSEQFPGSIRHELGERLIVQDLPPSRWGLPNLRSARNPLSTLWRSNDVGLKRNLGLAAAALEGWKYLLFVDDDISSDERFPTLDEDSLRNALATMDNDANLQAVGWTMENFPDNSVLGHALRLAGEPQQIFISGGALLVRCNPDTPFFPTIYNEDWLFLIATAQRSPDYRNCLGWIGQVRQRPYEPYSASRTKSEEAGDVIGEGLMNLLEDDGPGLWATGTTPRYWKAAMARRASLIIDITDALDNPGRTPEQDRALHAMRTALRTHRHIRPDALRNYIVDWRSDLRSWQKYLTTLAGLRPAADQAGHDILTRLRVLPNRLPKTLIGDSAARRSSIPRSRM
jgi:hypothetical protein